MVVTPQPRLVSAKGGWAFAIAFVDALGNPINLATAGLTPYADFYQGNLGRTTACAVAITNAGSGACVATVPQDVAQSTLAPSPASQLLPGSELPPAPYPYRLHVYLVDSLDNASADQIIAVLPVDPRTTDLSSLTLPSPLNAVVGPAGAPGGQGNPGPAGVAGSSDPRTATAAGAIAKSQAIYLGPTGALPASSDQVAEAGLVLGIALAAAALGAQVTYSGGGLVTDDAWNWSSGPIYLGINGALTQTPPTHGFVQQVATALTPTTIAVGLRPPVIIVLPPNTSSLVGASYQDLAAGQDVVRLAATAGGPANALVGTNGAGFLDPSLFDALSIPPGRLKGGTHLAGLPNGNFEDGFAGWGVGLTGTATASIDAGTAVVGQNSAYLHCAAGGDVATLVSSLVPVGEGIAVYVATRAKIRSGTVNGVLTALFYDRAGTLLAQTTIGAALALTATFGEFGGMVTPPANTRYAAVSLSNSGAVGAVGAVSVDEIMLARPLAGITTAQITRAARPVIVAAGGTLSGFQSAIGPDATDGSWEAITYDRSSPIGGVLYTALSAYFTDSLAMSSGAATAALATIWANALTY